MTTHVALLRGIDVGRAQRIAMADLRSVIESEGGGAARTVQSSGSIVLSASRGRVTRGATTDTPTTRNWTTVANLHAAADDERDGG